VLGESITGMAELSFGRRNGEAIVTGLIVAGIVGCVAFLYGKYPTFLNLLTYCLICGVATFVACAAVIILKRIPKPSPMPNEENIESYIRTWLDNHRMTITKDPSPATYFRYRIQLSPDNEQLTIFRMRDENPEYIQVYTDLGLKGEEGEQILSRFSQNEINQILFEIKLELARAKVGYSGLVIPPTDFKIFRRVLIHSTLKESEFISAISEVEAAIHLVLLIYLRANQQKNYQADSPTMPPVLASNSPISALPEFSS
jgi:hypothetical protein